MSEQYTLKDRINQYYDKKAAGEDVSSFKLAQPEELNKLQHFEAGPKTVTQFENNPTGCPRHKSSWSSCTGARARKRTSRRAQYTRHESRS